MYILIIWFFNWFWRRLDVSILCINQIIPFSFLLYHFYRHVNIYKYLRIKSFCHYITVACMIILLGKYIFTHLLRKLFCFTLHVYRKDIVSLQGTSLYFWFSLHVYLFLTAVPKEISLGRIIVLLLWNHKYIWWFIFSWFHGYPSPRNFNPQWILNIGLCLLVIKMNS